MIAPTVNNTAPSIADITGVIAVPFLFNMPYYSKLEPKCQALLASTASILALSSM